MIESVAVDGSPLGPESIRMVEYLKTRSAELSASAICQRLRAAARSLKITLLQHPPIKCGSVRFRGSGPLPK